MIYLGVAVIASPQSYDIAVTGNGDNIHARDLGSTRITLYNDSPDKARIVLTSFEDKFNPAVLAGRGGSVTVTGGGGGAGGVITGFNASLPSGDNNIGRVKVTEMPAIDFVLGALPAGTNNIGKVEVSKLPPLASVGGKIGDVGIQGGVTITSMPPVQVTNDPVRGTCRAWSGTVDTTHVTFDMVDGDVLKFSYISNDGDTDLFINFDAAKANPDDLKGAGLSGKNASIWLKPGEIITEFTRKTTKVNMIRKSGNGVVRILGV